MVSLRCGTWCWRQSWTRTWKSRRSFTGNATNLGRFQIWIRSRRSSTSKLGLAGWCGLIIGCWLCKQKVDQTDFYIRQNGPYWHIWQLWIWSKWKPVKKMKFKIRRHWLLPLERRVGDQTSLNQLLVQFLVSLVFFLHFSLSCEVHFSVSFVSFLWVSFFSFLCVSFFLSLFFSFLWVSFSCEFHLSVSCESHFFTCEFHFQFLVSYFFL